MQSQIFRIVFQDSELLVIEKLRPFLSQRGDRGSKEGLDEFLSRNLGKKIFPIHRLDREVLGLMVFAQSARSAENLSDQFRNREVQKGYEAHVVGTFRESKGELVHYLKKNEKTNYVTVYPRPTEGAKKAELEYFVLDQGPREARLYIKLKTGRTHQIRVQLAKIGHSILGDTRYGKRTTDSDLDAEGPDIQLRSVFLSLKNPSSGERHEWTLLDMRDFERLKAENFL